jgi:vacuolar-type H+-ATPase subunit I/STV1
MSMKDESHLPVAEQSLVFRLRKRAEIRRQIKDRKSVQEGTADRIADLLEEAANEIDKLEQTIVNLVSARLDEL